MLLFCQTKIDLVLSATYAATEADYEGFYLPLPLPLNKAKSCHTARRPDWRGERMFALSGAGFA